MAIFAVRVDVVQTLQTETEVVIKASSPAEALRAAKAELESVLPRNYGPSTLVYENMEAGEIRQVSNPDDDALPYVYDIINNRPFSSEDVGSIIAPEPDLDSDPYPLAFDFETLGVALPAEEGVLSVEEPVTEWATPVELVVTEAPVEETVETLEVPATVAIADAPVAPAFKPPKNTGDGVVLQNSNSFRDRPTAGVERPLTTLPNGYTPLDHEIRKHAVFPYYLQGPACVELGEAEYCGSTGQSQKGADPATCPAPKTWTAPAVEEVEDENDEDDWGDDDHYWDD